MELEHIGEGYSGDYDPANPEDKKLLRFTVLKDGVQVDDASYCTMILETSPIEAQIRVCTEIMLWVYSALKSGAPIKRICERLSWIES